MFLKLTIAFLLCMLVTLNASAQWQQVTSIEGGKTRDLEKIDQKIWAATDGGIYKSTDEGQTWVRDESFSASWSVLDISPIDDMIFVLLSEYPDAAKHVYRSGDGGETWEKVLTRNGGFSVLEIYEIFRIDEVIFARIDNSALWSDDDGNTWQNINFSGSVEIGFPYELGHDEHNIVVTSHLGLYLSQDLGQTWDSLGPLSSDVPPFLEDSVIIVIVDDSLFLSNDLGGSWQPFPLPGDFYQGLLQRGASGKLYAKDYLLYVSEDNGASWDTVNTVHYSRPRDFLELDSGDLLISTDVGFYLTSEQGAVWKESNAGFVSVDVIQVFISPMEEYFIYTNVGHRRSSDAGQSWESWSFPQNEYPVKMYWIAEDSVLITTNRRNLYLATDDVQVYQKIVTPLSIVLRLKIEDEVLYLRNVSGTLLLRSHDFGITWDTIGLPSIDQFQEFAVIGQNIVLIEDENIWQSPDRGMTWNFVYQFATSGVLQSLFHNIGARLLNTNGFQWVFSDTGGATWEELSPTGLPVEKSAINSMLWIEDVLFAVIPLHGVYVSFDLGEHWLSYNEGLETLRGQTLAYSNDILALGTSQGSIWLRDISSTVDAPLEELTQDLLVYPVPGNGTFNFILPESVHGITRFEVTDLSGRHVYSAALNSIHGSLPEIHIDLMAGIYVATLTFQDQRYVSKIVIGK